MSYLSSGNKTERFINKLCLLIYVRTKLHQVEFLDIEQKQLDGLFTETILDETAKQVKYSSHGVNNTIVYSSGYYTCVCVVIFGRDNVGISHYESMAAIKAAEKDTKILVNKYRRKLQIARETDSGREIISRKFAENPFIPKNFWNMVKQSYLMGTDSADLATVLHLRDKGKDVGITTGGVIAMATTLANKGEIVVVPIYEHFRNYAP